MDKKSMRGASHIAPRNGVYQFSRRVPKSVSDGLNALPPTAREKLPDDLRDYFAKQFVRFSLKTRDKAEAKRLGTTADFQFESKVERVLAWLARPDNHYDVVDPNVIKAMVRRWVSQSLDDDEKQRLSPHSGEYLKENTTFLYLMELEFQEALSLDGGAKHHPIAQDIVGDLEKTYGLQLDPTGQSYALMHREILLGYLLISDTIKRRNKGEVAPTPDEPTVVLQDAVAEGNSKLSLIESTPHINTLTLGEVIDEHLKGCAENSFKRKIVRCLQLFGEFIGRDTPENEVRQLQVTRYLRDICRLPVNWARRFDKGEALQDMLAPEIVENDDVDDAQRVVGMSPSTWEQTYRYPLGTFFTNAVRDRADYGFRNLTVNGIDYVGTRKYDEAAQRALSLDELKVLFEGDVFRGIAQDPNEEELYWLSLLAFFTGARPREICQLNPQCDIGEACGFGYMDITTQSPAGKGVVKRVKTGEGRRIPIHTRILHLGFLDYVERLKNSGADRLFPRTGTKSGNPYQVIAVRFTQLLKDTGLYDDEAPPGRLVLGLYVARKSFVTHARNQGVVSREITGHADDGTTQIQRDHYITEDEPFMNKVNQLRKFDLEIHIPKHSYAQD